MELKSDKLVFQDFYKTIRTHFSTERSDYDDFKCEKSLEDKLRYLLQHKVVQEQLDVLNSGYSKPQNLIKTEKSDWKTKVLESGNTDFSYVNPKRGANFPQLSSKAKLSHSKKSGRKIVSTQKISPGEVIIREKPFATVLYPEFQATHCLTCFKFINENPIECKGCKKVNFCSELCHTLGQSNFHWSECAFLEEACLQTDPELGIMAMLVYRAVVEAGFDKVVRHSSDQVEDKEAVYDSNDYLPVVLQVTHESKRDSGEHFRRLLTSLYLCHFLNLSGYFPEREDGFYSSENLDLVSVACQVSRHLMSCSCNAYEIGEMVRSEWEGQLSQELGGAIYPTVSLTNHSCAPNTMRYSDGILCVMRASRTINPGDEIFDNYGTFYQVDPLESRISRLRKQYFFDCECQACKHDWPTVDVIRRQPIVICCLSCGSVIDEKKKKCAKCKRDLKNISKLSKTLASLEEVTKKSIKDINRDNSEKYLQYFLPILLEMERHVRPPSWQWILCRQAINQCFTVTGNYRTE